MEKKPNIIIVMTDQQRADLRRACGYELDTMPFLDSWAEGGVDFARAYTPNPTCMPARVSMFTGRYSQCHQVRTNHNMADALYTADLLDVLRENGYVTALCGKNHSHREPEAFDFHETCGHLGYEGEENFTREEIEFADFLCSTRHMEIHRPSPGGVEVQHPYRNVTSALKFMDEVKDGQPFFAWVSFAEPHNPYQVPEPYFDLFPPDKLPPLRSQTIDLEGKGQRFVWLRHTWEKILGKEIDDRIQRARSNYHGMLRLIDDQFRRLVEGVRERGLEDNTVILYLSDHGDFAGEYGLIRKGPDLPELLCHIPFIWRGPGIRPSGRGAEGFVNIVDILPTICEMIGVQTPFGCQGKSILPLLTGTDIPAREYEYAYAESGFGGLYWKEGDELDLISEGASKNMETFDCLNTWTQCGQVRALWKGDYHLQLDMLGSGYLYHLASDPVEIHNLWEEPSCRDVKEDMLKSLAEAMMQAADPLPVPHARYRTKVHPRGYRYQEFQAADPGVRRMEPIGGIRSRGCKQTH